MISLNPPSNLPSNTPSSSLCPLDGHELLSKEQLDKIQIEDNEIIGFVWHSPNGEVVKHWNKSGSPGFDSPSCGYGCEVMEVGENNSYSYNTWITKKYRGSGKHLNLRSFREMERIGKDSIIHDVEIWNKYTIVHCIKSLNSNIIDLLEK